TSLGPPVERSELAALLAGPFVERRLAKQQLLGEAAIDGDTEVLALARGAAPSPALGSPEPIAPIAPPGARSDAPAAPSAGAQKRPVHSRWQWSALLAALPLAGVALGS